MTFRFPSSGVAGGATAAARARRVSELSAITMFERGNDISVASCGLPYHVAGEIRDRGRLVMATPEYLKTQLNVDVNVGHNVESIDRKNKTIKVRLKGTKCCVCRVRSAESMYIVCEQVHNKSKGSQTVGYDKLLIATGATALVPPIPGLRESAAAGRLLTMRSLEVFT